MPSCQSLCLPPPPPPPRQKSDYKISLWLDEGTVNAGFSRPMAALETHLSFSLSLFLEKKVC